MGCTFHGDRNAKPRHRRRISSQKLIDRPLGILPDDHWEEVEVELGTGDRLVLFSDGVLDLLEDPDDWPRAVGAWVAEADDLPSFLTAMARHATEETPLDDITVVAVFRQGVEEIG